MLPIRVRLTLWYLLIFGLALVALTAIVYAVLSENLRAEVDRTLLLKAADVHMTMLAKSEIGSHGEIPLPENMLSPMNEFSSPGVYIQITDARGVVIATSTNIQGWQLPVDPAVIADGLAGKRSIVTLAADQNENLRVVTMPLTQNNRILGLIQVGQSLHNVDITIRQIGYYLILSVLGTLVVGGIAGWFLAGKALSSIDEITRTAQLIETEQDLGRRIEFKGPQDEIGRLVSTLNEMIGRIEDTFQMQRRFIADSSHELRTPLTVIRGNVDLLERDVDEECRQESLQSIKRETERMSKIVSDLLLLAQLDRQQLVERKPVQLDTILLETFREAKLLAGGRKVEIGLEDVVTVQGDADQLRRMFWNLVSNAIKYTPEDGKITLSLYKKDDWAYLKVTDTGIGIAEEDVPHLFDRFYRVDKARSRAQGGTGLGLAIVKSIAEMHGGKVKVASSLGKGSSFLVQLKL